MAALIAIFLLPIIFLNFAGSIVAGIWLIVIGKWTLVLGALISTLISSWILGLLMLPTLILVAPLTWAAKRKNHFFIFVIGALSTLWTLVLMLLYGVGSFIFVFNNYEGGMILPYLFLAYSVSTAPWTYMASQEARGDGGAGAGTQLPVFGICFSSLAMILSTSIYGISNITALVIFCTIPLAIVWILQMTVVFLSLEESSI